jgi:hypothetical protein
VTRRISGREHFDHTLYMRLNYDRCNVEKGVCVFKERQSKLISLLGYAYHSVRQSELKIILYLLCTCVRSETRFNNVIDFDHNDFRWMLNGFPMFIPYCFMYLVWKSCQYFQAFCRPFGLKKWHRTVHTPQWFWYFRHYGVIYDVSHCLSWL